MVFRNQDNYQQNFPIFAFKQKAVQYEQVPWILPTKEILNINSFFPLKASPLSLGPSLTEALPKQALCCNNLFLLALC